MQSILGMVEIDHPQTLIANALQERMDFAKRELVLSLVEGAEDKEALQRLTAHDLMNLVIDLQFGTDPKNLKLKQQPQDSNYLRLVI